MNITASGARMLLLLVAAGTVAALASGCGSNAAPTPGTTVTVTASPPSGGGSQPSATAPSTPAPPAGPAECTTAELHVAIGESNGAAGTIFYGLDFTNITDSTCFMQGYPGVSLVSTDSGAGSQIGADAKRDPVTPSKQLLIPAEGTAHAVLGVAEAGNFPASKCNPVSAMWLKVFPPDQTVPAYVPFTTQTCASTSEPTMRITAVSAGT